MDLLYHVVGETVALGIDSLILGFCIKQVLKCRSVISSLNDAPTLDNNIKSEIEKYPNKIIPYAVIRGLIRPLGSPIKSLSNDNINGVVQRLTVKKHMMARTTAGFWSQQSKTLQEVYNHIPFVLSLSGTEVEINDALEATLLDMDVVHDHFEPLTQSFTDIIWGFFMGIHQRTLQTTEEMLRVGTYITAVGEINGNEGNIKLQPPKELPMYLTTLTKNTLMKKVKDSQDFLKVLIFLSGTVAVVLSGRIIMKIVAKKKKEWSEIQMKKALAVSRKERRSQVRNKDSTDQLCVVCTENPKEVIILPCGHVSLCEDCSDNIKDKCPICRTPIASKSPAFIT